MHITNCTIKDYMTDWIKSNAWALIMVIASLVASYSVGNYKVGELEKKVQSNQERIAVMESSDINNKITLATIQKDIEFIKYQLSRIIK